MTCNLYGVSSRVSNSCNGITCQKNGSNVRLVRVQDDRGPERRMNYRQGVSR